MNGSCSEWLDDIDTLQRSIKRIVQGYADEINRLRSDLVATEARNNTLHCQNRQILTKLKTYEEYLKSCKCRNWNISTDDSFKIDKKGKDEFVGYQDDILKEVQDISTLELDSQFVSDSDAISGNANQDNSLNSPRFNILDKLFLSGLENAESSKNVTSKTPPSNDTILAVESPCKPSNLQPLHCVVPESLPQHFNETTPRKVGLDRIEKQSVDIEDVNIAVNPISPRSSPVIKLTPNEKLFGDKKGPFNISQLISPSRRLNDFHEDETPKRKVKQSNSPRRKKRVSSLKTSNRIEAELSCSGVRKLTQTQLNIVCFKKARTEENIKTDSVGNPKKSSPEMPDSMEDICGKERDKKNLHSTPLISLENSPDMNETNLTASALRKVAADIAIDIKPILTTKYDRSLEEKKSLKKRLECSDCIELCKRYGNINEESKVKCYCAKPDISGPTTYGDIGNCPDMNETNLSASAAMKVASDAAIDFKPILESSYDRIPEVPPLEGKALRKRLPGQECHDCVKFYNLFGDGNEGLKQELLNRCSRHRTKNIPLNSTPEGFWKPIITQTPQ